MTEHFVDAGALPPAFETLYHQSKAQDQQSGGFADFSKARISYIEGMMQQSQGKNDAALASFLDAVERLERDRENCVTSATAARSWKTRSVFTTRRFYNCWNTGVMPRRSICWNVRGAGNGRFARQPRSRFHSAG